MSVAKEMEVIRSAIETDESYAWAWHCNLAMCAFDEGVDHTKSQYVAARFMQLCFGVDTSKAKEFKELIKRLSETPNANT